MKIIKTLLCALMLLSLLPLSGCAAWAEETRVVASFYPVYILAQNVLSDVPGVTLSCMTAPATGCLHDYQLLTGDMRSLSGAGALLINGAGMEGFLPQITDQFPQLPVIDCSLGVTLLPNEAQEEDHDHKEDHDHGEWNAHIWLDPQNAILMVENMRAGLAALIPEQAGKINENAAAYAARLNSLDQELAAEIALLPRKEIVTFHEAFPYFARAYGLNVVAVVALEPDEPVSPHLLSHVAQAVLEAGCPPLFAEPQYENAALKAISQETNAPVFELDPLVTGNGEIDAYEAGMRKNLAVLKEALQ